jgi:hypothetical protein
VSSEDGQDSSQESGEEEAAIAGKVGDPTRHSLCEWDGSIACLLAVQVLETPAKVLLLCCLSELIRYVIWLIVIVICARLRVHVDDADFPRRTWA